MSFEFASRPRAGKALHGAYAGAALATTALATILLVVPGGTGEGKAFDVTNYVTTLSLVRADGLEPSPPPPAAEPNG